MSELQARIDAVNEQAIGRDPEEFEFRASVVELGWADVHFRGEGGRWVARVPSTAVSIEILEAIRAAVSIGIALGRDQGKREIGDFLRNECGLL